MVEKLKKDTEKELIDMSEIREAFVGSVICLKCGQDHDYGGLDKGRYCTNCGEDLVEELF